MKDNLEDDNAAWKTSNKISATGEFSKPFMNM